jgi:hypothetical protein
MRRPDQSPSIVPPEANQDTYLVLDDFGGRLGRAWRETDEEDTDRETLIRDLMDDQYGNPLRIVAFNTAACRKSNPEILMMQPAQYRTTIDVPYPLYGARYWRILPHG